MGNFFKLLKSKTWVFQITVFVLTAIGLIFSLMPSRLFVPSFQEAFDWFTFVILLAAALTVVSLIVLQLSNFKDSPARSLGYSFAWLAFAFVFIGFPFLVLVMSDLFPPDLKPSIQAADKQVRMYETSCFLESRYDCNDYKTELYLQRPYSPIMTKIASCPCYFDEAAKEKNGKLELRSTSCTDNQERRLLMDIKTGKLEQNECA